MAKEDAEPRRVLAEFGRLCGESHTAFFDQVVIRPFPKAPGITGSQLPAEGDTPEHGHHLHTQFRAQVQQSQQVVPRPLLDGAG